MAAEPVSQFRRAALPRSKLVKSVAPPVNDVNFGNDSGFLRHPAAQLWRHLRNTLVEPSLTRSHFAARTWRNETFQAGFRLSST